MNLNGNKARLTGLTRELLLKWSDTKNHWQDAKSREFESRHMAELTASVDRTLIIVDKLEALLRKVRSDCE
ncbi:MAG: hypothetical protein ABSE48_00050 [Verrucomicrobiota bacterium]|jgi:hypothetical protein